MRLKIMTRTLCSALQTQLVLLPDFLYSQSNFYRTSTGNFKSSSAMRSSRLCRRS